jgi:small GTP-binding protein
MGIFNFLKKDRVLKNKAIFCGLDNSGKSTIIPFIKEGRFVQHTPTMGKNKEDLIIKGTRLALVDLGGQTHFRKMWLGELARDTKVVAFVVDRSAPERFEEAKAELTKMIPIIKSAGLKFFLFANKSDKPNAVPISEIYEIFALTELDSFEILEISAKTGYGIVNAFVKFYSALTGDEIKRNAVAKAISIYNTGGIPIITESQTMEEINEKALEGGFLSAVTHFAKNKMGGNAIKFETDTGDTFIVRKSDNFIGALLWNHTLPVPIDESEDALKELLNHLETCMPGANDPNQTEQVKYFLQQYATNMI